MWSGEHEAHNRGLLKRQEVLGGAWSAFLKANPSGEGDALRTAWMKARGDALRKAGLDTIFE